MSEVVTAVGGIPLKLTFKGAFFFALQPLATLCDPGSAQGAINGLQALQAGALPRLTPALKKFVDDDQIPTTVLRIMEAMVHQMCLVDDEAAVEEFVRSGAHEAVVDWIIAHKSKEQHGDRRPEDKTLRCALNIVNSLSASKPALIPAELTTKLAGVMLQGLTPQTSVQNAAQLIDLAAGAVTGQDSAAVMAKSGGVKCILDYLNGTQISQAEPAESMKFVQKALGVVGTVYKDTPMEPAVLNSVMQLADRFSAAPAVQEKCQRLMQTQLSPDAFRTQRAKIGDKDAAPEEKLAAMKALVPMSYVPNLVAACDGTDVSVLIQALRDLAKGTIPGAEPEAFRGCAKMLGNVAKKPAMYQKVMDAGALDVCLEILKTNKQPAIISAICPLIAPLCATQQGAEQFLSDEFGFSYLLDIMGKASNTGGEAEVMNAAQGIATVIQSICATKTCCDHVADSEALDVLNKFLKNSTVSSATAEKIADATASMISGLSDVDAVEPKRFFALIDTACANSEHTGPVALNSLAGALGQLATKPSAKTALEKALVCEAAFKILARVPIGSPAYKNCLKAVELFADEQIYEKVTSEMRKLLSGKNGDRNKIIGQFGVLSALGNVPRLQKLIEKDDLDTVLSSHLKTIALQKSTGTGGRSAEATACTDCLNSLFTGKTARVKSLTALFEFAKSDELRADQSKNSNSKMLSTALHGVKKAIESGCFKDLSVAELTKITEQTLEVMQENSDSRMGQVLGTEILGAIAAYTDHGAQAITMSNADAFIVQSSRKFKMWADLQLASFQALEGLVNANSDEAALIERLRQANVLDAIRSAQVTHSRVEALRGPLQRVAQRIMPEGYLEQAVQQAVRDLRLGMQDRTWNTMQNDLDTLLGLVDWPEGHRIAAKTAVIPLLTDLLSLTIGDSDAPPQMAADIAKLLAVLTNGSTGCRAALKCGTGNAIEGLIAKYNSQSALPDADTLVSLTRAVANLVSKDPKEAKVLQRMAPKFADLAKTLASGDPTSQSRLDDATHAMMMSMPDELRLKDPVCEGMVAGLIRDLESGNWEKSGKAALKLKTYAKQDATCTHLMAKGVLTKTYEALDTHSGSPAILQQVALLERLSAVPEYNVSDDTALKRVQMLTRLIQSSNGAEFIAPAMTVLARQIQSHKNPDIFESMDGLYDTIRHAQGVLGADKDKIADSIGAILNVVGGEAGLVSWLNNLGELSTKAATSPEAEAELLSTLNESEIYLKTQIKKADAIVEPFERCAGKVGDLVKMFSAKPASELNRETLKGVAKLVKQSCLAIGRVHDTAARQQMAVSLTEHVTEPLTAAVVAVLKDPESSDPEVISAALEAYAELLNNADTGLAAVEACGDGGVIDAMMEYFNSEKQLPEECRGAQAAFMKALTKDAAGTALVTKSFKKSKPNKADPTMSLLGWQFQKLNDLDTTQLPLLDAELTTQIPLLRDDSELRKEFWAHPEYLNQIDELANAQGSTMIARKIGVIAAACADNVDPEKLHVLEGTVSALREKFDSGRMNQQQITETTSALLESLQMAGNSLETQQALRRNRVFDLIGELTSEAARSPGFYKTILPTLADLSDICEQNATAIIHDVIPTIIKDKLMFANDNEAKAKLSTLLASAIKYKGNGYNLAQLDGFEELMSTLIGDEISGGMPPPDLLAELKELEELIKTDEPNVMTLRKVLALWQQELGEESVKLLGGRKRGAFFNHSTRGIVAVGAAIADSPQEIPLLNALTPATNAAVTDHIGFVFGEMSSRARGTSEKLTPEARAEILSGLECLRLLHLFAANFDEIEGREEDEIIASGIMNYAKDGEILQHFVNTGLDLVIFFPNIAPAFSSVPGFARAMLQCINAGRLSRGAAQSFEAESGVPTGATGAYNSTDPSTCMEHRLLFLAKIIPHRKWLDDTSAVEDLMQCWNDVDAGKFDEGVLYATMKCLRSCVSQASAEFLLQQKLPQRVLALVEDTTTAYGGLSDAFFFMGVLGVYPVMKEAIGNCGLVEAAIKFVKKHKDAPPNDPSSGAATNALLALGGVCVEHFKNVDRFVASRGIELSVAMISQAKADAGELPYDRVNAAAALLCNVSYKRDDVKELFAKAKAPEAVMAAIAGYDGSAREDITRCMHSMFKAVGNMALYAPNVKHFVDHGIVGVFQNFLKKASEMHPSVHEAGVKCLANLLMENDAEVTEAFSALVPTIVEDMSNRLGHSEVEIFRHGLEALQYLAREEANARTAIDCKIIPNCVVAAETTSSLVVLNSVISFIASLSRHESLVRYLADQGVLTAVMNVLDKEKSVAGSSTELSQKSFIVMRRLFKDTEIAQKFIAQGSAPAIAKMIVGRAESASAQIEGGKLLIFLLKTFPPPTGEADNASDEWEEEEPGNEGFMPVSHLIKRPLGPRSYQQLALTPNVISDLIMTLTQTMSGSNGSTLHKFLEVGLMLLGYFAHEKIIGCEDAFFRANFFPAAQNVLNDNLGNVLYADIIAGIAANIACVADDSAFTVFKSHHDFATALKNSSKLIDKEYKVEKRYIVNVASTALDEASNQLSFLPYAAFDFDFDRVVGEAPVSGNGVQDLSPAVKQVLRKGGEFWVITADNLKGERHTWKASLDLLRLQWAAGKDRKLFDNECPVLRCTSIKPGASTPVLAEARKAHKLSCQDTCLCAIFGVAGEGEPFNLRFKNHTQRDAFCRLIKEWRDAAANIA